MDHTTDAETATNLEAKTQSFGPVHIVEPKSEHTHTAVILHGRGSTGEDFACRWVFPSSPELWSTTFQENIPAWFEAYSLTDITARQDLQISGIKASVDHVNAILSEEIRHLGGNSQRLLFGGTSQGGAVALWNILSQQDSAMKPGAFVVASTWLPFATNIERAFTGKPGPTETPKTEFDEFVEKTIAIKNLTGMTEMVQDSPRLPPVFIGHGADDAYVDVELGRHVTRIIAQAGFSVEWKEYSGVEEEGHWFKIPDEIDDIQGFLSHIGWMG